MTTTPGRLRWRKSSYSGGSSECVEVAHDAQRVHVRNSNAPDAGTLLVAPTVMAAWTAGVKAGDIDDLVR